MPLVVLLMLLSCVRDRTSGKSAPMTGRTLSKVSPVYAKGFKVYNSENYRILEIFVPRDLLRPVQRFYLIDNDDVSVPDDGVPMHVPVKSMVCFSATHFAFANALDVTDRISGVLSARFVVSPEQSYLIDSGMIAEVGAGGHYQLEKLLRLDPQIIMVSPQKGQSFDPLVNAGLQIVMNGDFLETTPLGRAEWIKMVGLLFGKEKTAQQIFDSISDGYNKLKALTENVAQRPVVLSGKQYGGFWSLPGGKSYVARFIEDAGGRYLFAGNENTGSLTLDFEAVYQKGIDAAFWRFLVYAPGGFSYEKLLDEDKRYADFRAFKDKKIFVCNTYQKPYYQKGLLEPQVILADYIAVLHPGLLPGRKNVYFNLLP